MELSTPFVAPAPGHPPALTKTASTDPDHELLPSLTLTAAYNPAAIHVVVQNAPVHIVEPDAPPPVPAAPNGHPDDLEPYNPPPENAGTPAPPSADADAANM